MEFNLEKIKSLEPGELLDVAYSSLMEMKPIELRKIEQNELSIKMRNPKFDDIKKMIKYDESQEVLKITVPVYDERERDPYKISLLAEGGLADMLPIWGYFVQGTAELIIKPLGLVEVVYSGFKIARNDRDFRYLQHRLEYKKTEYFIYDYKEKKYLRVPGEELEKAKWDIQKKGEADLKSAHELVKMYLEREEVLEYILTELKARYEIYQVHLHRFLKDQEEVSGQTTIASVRDFLVRYAEFLNTHMPMGLKLKILFSKVTQRESNELLKEAERLIGVLNIGMNMLKKISDSINGEVGFDLIKEESRLGVEELELRNQLIAMLNNGDLVKFKMLRPTNFTLAEPMKGYIGYDLKTSEVFPNVAQLEKRLTLTEQIQEDAQDEIDHMNKILKLKKS